MMRPNKSGFTVLEMFVALTIFSGIMIITTLLLRQSVWIWTSGDSREDSGMALRKARAALSRDLQSADLDPGDSGEPHFGQTQVPSSLAGGDALWFLSATDINGAFSRDPDGYPFWQRNILYYLVKPQNHDALYGTTCQVSSNPDGDDVCPHKMLIRLVIDNPPVTDPLPPPGTPPPPGAQPEQLLTDAEVATYLLAPNGTDVSAIQALAGVEEAKIVTTRMLWFEVEPDPFEPLIGRRLELRASSIKEAAKVAPVGSTPLYNHPTTNVSLFSLFPNN